MAESGSCARHAKGHCKWQHKKDRAATCRNVKDPNGVSTNNKREKERERNGKRVRSEERRNKKRSKERKKDKNKMNKLPDEQMDNANYKTYKATHNTHIIGHLENEKSSTSSGTARNKEPMTGREGTEEKESEMEKEE